MTHTATFTSRFPRRVISTAAAVCLAATVAPAPSASAAEAIAVSSPAAVAGKTFTVNLSGLTKGAQYKLALTGTSATDRTNLAEANDCATFTALDVTTTCTLTEQTATKYDLKLLNADGTATLANTPLTVTTETSVTQPVATDRAGTASDTLTLTYTPGVTWTVESASGGTVTTADGTSVTPTTRLFDPATAKAGEKIDLKVLTADGKTGTDVTVKATAADGYTIPGGDQTHTLRVTSAATLEPTLTIGSASQPVANDAPGTENDTVTVKAVPGVRWFIGNTEITPTGDETSKTIKVTPVDGKVTVVARAADGRAFADGRLAEEFVLQYTNTPAEPTSTRVEGSDRIGTSVAISKKYFDASVDTVYVANGWSSADALAAGPAAARDNAPLLLTEPTALTTQVIEEIKRLSPTTIKVVGGTKAVSAEVEAQLKGLAAVQRLEGDDRIGTAIAVSRQWASTETAYVANGWKFADALSGGSAAATEGAPLMLALPGDMTDATIARLKALGVKNVKLVGGPDVLNTTVANQADSLGTLVRYGTATGNRYSTSAEIVKGVTGGKATTAFLATGEDFPDALAGIPAAKKVGAPLALMAPTCTPMAMKTELDKLPLTSVVRLGGAKVLADFPLTKTCGW